MKDKQPNRGSGSFQSMGILSEAALVVCLGIAFGLCANFLSPKGLKLTRNYFPGHKPVSAQTTQLATQNTLLPAPATNPSRPTESAAAARLKLNGLQAVDTPKALQLHKNSLAAPHETIFVDARDDQHFQEGHIPGAWQLDHYRAEKYLANLIPACQAASQIIVYCNGGDCEDSESTAILLRDIGIPNQKLFVYSAGITEWIAKKLPLESDSGNTPAKP